MIKIPTLRSTPDGDRNTEEEPGAENRPQRRQSKKFNLFRKRHQFAVPLFAFLAFVFVVLPGMLAIVQVPPGHIGIIYSKVGADLPVDQILAKENQKGVREEFLTPGWHLINPLWTKVEVEPETVVRAGMVGVQTSMVGTPLPKGRLLAERGEKGVLRELLTPGTYQIHPYATKIAIFPEVVIPAGSVGVQNSLVGEPLPKGQLLAEPGQKGVLRELLTPGTYRIHPHARKIEIRPEITIPAGAVGVQTSMVGAPLPERQQLAERGQKGVLRELLTPGTYRIHPHERTVKLYPAVDIEAGFVGIQVAKTGRVPSGNQILAGPTERGVRAEYLPAGMHFINPLEFEIIKTDLRTQRYTMADADAVEFPSKDGFEIRINVIIEWGIDRSRASEVVASIGTQQDIIDKIIRPNARSISRTEGSKYVAKDFIVGLGREEFQSAFFKSLAAITKPKGIIVHRALVLTVIVPDRIAAPIKEAVVAVEEELRNAQQIETAKSAARLAFESSLAQQNQRKVEAETRKLERQLNAEAAANEAEIEAKGRVTVSQLAYEASKVEARSILETGKAKSEVVRLEQEAQTAGMVSAVAAFGDPKAYAMYEFATHLSPNVKVVFAPAGEGTLWTSLDEFFKVGPQDTILKKRPNAQILDR